MSAFIAVIDDGVQRDAPLPTTWAESIARIAHRGPHGVRTVQLDGLRMAVATRRISSRDKGILQPWVDPLTGVIVAMDGRLDAATELADRLEYRGLSTRPPDVELVGRAYSCYGNNFAAELNGEFSVVVYDPRKRTAFAARDTLGSRMVYWARTPTGIVISNELPAVRRFPGVKGGLDPLAIADFLMFGYAHVFDKRRTPFASIEALAPSESLAVHHGGARVWRYRSFCEMLRPVRRLSPTDVPNAFRDVFSEAIVERMEAQSIFIPLSGGLDSTTIAATAHRLEQQGRSSARMTAITGLTSESDPEGSLAREVASHLGIDHRIYVIRPGTFLGDPTPTWYPVIDFFPKSLDELVKADISSTDIAIFGSAGDSLLCHERTTWIGMLRRHGLQHTANAWSALRASGRSLSWGTGLLSKGWEASQQMKFDSLMPHGRPPWLAPTFVSDYRLEQRWADLLRSRPVDDLHPVHPHAQVWLQWGNWFAGQQTAGLDYTPNEWTDPFLDFRVISFCFSLPPEPWMFRKQLLREAGSGLLPESILERPKSPAGNYAAPWIRSADRQVIDGWQMSPELDVFIDRDAIPPIVAEVEGENGYMNFRPLMLQRWFSCLGRW